jgi:hypothetical protein
MRPENEVPEIIERSVRNRTQWAEWLRWSRRLSDDDQSIPNEHVCSLRRAGWELDRRERAPCSGEPPRPDVRTHEDDEALAIGEDDVDGEAHAEGMDGLTGRDDQSRAFGQAIASEQAAAPRR